jgi:hypothetical protein
MSVIKEINGYLPLKPSSVGNPDIYLGTKLKVTQLPNGVTAWGLSPSKYVVQAVKNCQLHLTENLAGRYSISTLGRIIRSLLTMTLPLTSLTFWTLTVLHSISTLLV